MTITEIEEYKGDTWKLELDNNTVCYVNEAVVSDFSLRMGQELSGEQLSRIRDADTLRKAKKRALYLLGSRQYCRKELFMKLKRTYGEEVANAAADYVCEMGYVNDEDYAPKLAEYLIHGKRWGLRKTRYEMLRRGLDENIVEDALAEFSEEEIDEEITALLEKRYYSKISDPDDRRRTIAAFARRGYDYRAVKRCIENMLDDYEDDDENDDYEEDF
jgi:regulatory protein